MVPLHQMFVPCSPQPGWRAPSWTSTLLSCHSLSFRHSSHRILPRKCQAGSCLRTSVILVFAGCSFPRWHMFHITWLNLSFLSQISGRSSLKTQHKIMLPTSSLPIHSSLLYFPHHICLYHHLVQCTFAHLLAPWLQLKDKLRENMTALFVIVSSDTRRVPGI